MFGSKADRDYKAVKPILDKVLAVYPEIDSLSDDDLRAHSAALRQKVRDVEAPFEKRIAEIKDELNKDIPVEQKEALAGESDKLVKEEDEAIEKCLDEILPEAFSIVKSTARRFKENKEIVVTATDFDKDLSVSHDFVKIDGDKAVYSNHWTAGGNEVVWDMVHYDVQIIGGIALHQGKIAEMATGEGKTLVATLPVFLNALAGKGVHVVTVNDYLSKRDSEWMGPLYMFHGLSVDCIDKHEPNSKARRKAYECDITFGTNNEFGFDYLRDNMVVSEEDLVQRKHHYAIVDEVDSVLIDDARTPLIISGPVSRNKTDEAQFLEYKPYVEKLYQAQRAFVNQTLNDAKKSIAAGDEAEGGKLLLRAHKGLPKYSPLIKYLSEPGIKTLLQKAENYYMQDNEREMPVVTDPLFFVINEQLNTVDMTDKGHDVLAQAVGNDDFFVLPDVGSQTAEIEHSDLSPEEKLQKKDELRMDFSTKSERVHTVIQLLKAYTMFEKDVDYVIMDGKVKIVDESTGRIMEGRRWSDGLHQAVEAKENVKVEGITQTFATITLQNYFRMYHKLAGMTGTAETEAGEFWSIYKLDVMVIPTNRPVIRDDQPDRIYKTKKAKFAAVIDRIEEITKAGRPVLVGTSDVETSELLSRMLRMRGIKHNVLNAKEHAREADIVAQAGQSSTVTIATNMAGRGTDIKLSPEVKAAGGLAIIGTERHESRRVDRQLRGRAGRQGDPGSSVFYVSLEDKLMRLFGSERIAKVMDKLGFEEGERIESSMISSSIERAQKKVEENNFGIRKRLLEYDDVMNKQRTVIYEKRRHALMGERIGMDISNVIWDRVVSIISNNDYEGCQEGFLKVLAMECPFSEQDLASGKLEALEERAFEAAMEAFQRKTERIQTVAWPIIKQVYEESGALYERIMVPITDGKRVYNIPCNLKEAYDTEGKSVVKQFEKVILLHIIDDDWKENLRLLDELRHSVQNASYEQKDPLLIFKLESVKLWDNMIDDMNNRTASVLMRGQIPEMQPAEQVQEAQEEEHSQQYIEQKQDLDAERELEEARQAQQAAASHDTRETAQQTNHTPYRAEKMPRPNDPCPCGSGKKFKHCHGRGL